MDRSHAPAPQHPTAVRTAGSATLHLLLPAAAGECREPAPAPPARPTLPKASVFRKPQNGRRVGGEPQAHPTADAHPGHRSPLSQTELEPSCAGSPDLPVPASRCGNPPTQPRLEHRYYLHSDAWRFSLSGCGDGLVQPVRAQLGTLQYDGNRFLPRRVGCRVSFRPARNLELRSGLAVHRSRLPGSAPAARHRHQHGWTRACVGQRLHRTTVALAEIRTDLSRRLHQRPGSVHGTGKLLPLLQPPASAPGARLSYAGGPVPAQTQKERITTLMGDAVPQTPWDLPLFSSRVDVFRFAGGGVRRTLEWLDRRIGQRRDATRAPIQARSGSRPSGRLPVSPLHPSKDGQYFVQTMGSTSLAALKAAHYKITDSSKLASAAKIVDRAGIRRALRLIPRLH